MNSPAPFTVRPATLKDATAIYELIRANPQELIVRPLGDVVRNIDRFVVAVQNGEAVACASYSIYPEAGNFAEATFELTSLVVREDARNQGIGAKVVEAVIARVAPLCPMQLIVLTFTPGFFRKLGFQEISKHDIMHKIYMGCLNCMKYADPFTCPEVAMAINPNAYNEY